MTGVVGCGSRMKERVGSRVRWIEDWVDEEKRVYGWMDGVEV